MASENRFVLIGGPNGAGKSTIATAQGASSLLRDATPINPDIVTKGFQDKFKLPEDAANLLGVVQAELEVWKAISEGRSVAIETVLSTDKYLPVVAAAKRREFSFVLIYIALPSVELSIERVAARVLTGGHNVPEDKIRDRWERSMDSFVQFMVLADEVALFSNASLEPMLVGAKNAKGPFKLLDLKALPDITKRLRS